MRAVLARLAQLARFVPMLREALSGALSDIALIVVKQLVQWLLKEHPATIMTLQPPPVAVTTSQELVTSSVRNAQTATHAVTKPRAILLLVQLDKLIILLEAAQPAREAPFAPRKSLAKLKLAPMEQLPTVQLNALLQTF